MIYQNQESFILMGAGGHGAVVAEAIELCGGQIINFIDHDILKIDVFGHSVIRDENSISTEGHKFLITIGDNATRKARVSELNRLYGKIQHPSASVSKRALIGEGTVIMAGVCVNTSVIIGKHCIINTSSTIDHECLLGDYVHVAPSASLAGNVSVGQGTLIGLGAFIIQGVKIGKWCIIGAGSVIIRDVPDYSVVAGVPAKFIRINDKINEEEDLVVATPHE